MKWGPGPGSSRCSGHTPCFHLSLAAGAPSLFTSCFLAAAARRKTSEAGQLPPVSRRRQASGEGAAERYSGRTGRSCPTSLQIPCLTPSKGWFAARLGGSDKCWPRAGKPASLLSNNPRPLCFSASSKVAKDQGPELEITKGK